MTLEDKFTELISRSPNPYVMYLNSDMGIVKIEYRTDWDDGLDPYNNLRIINMQMGLSTAPVTWSHLMKSLKLNGITEEYFAQSVNIRIENMILRNHRDIVSIKEVFGTTYVDDLIEERGNMSFTEGLIDTVKRLIGRSTDESKPGLKLVTEEPNGQS